MKLLKSAWKHSLSRRMLLLLGILLLLPLLCAAAGKHTDLPPAGYTCAAERIGTAARLCSRLEAMGFQPFDSEAALRAAIDSGIVDCGVVLPAETGDAISAHRTRGLFLWLQSPTALVPSLRRGQAASALFSVAAPYDTADALAPFGIAREEVLAQYDTAMESDALFRFEISGVSGSFSPQGERSERYFKGAVSLLLFAAIYFGAALPLSEDAKRIGTRLGARAARRSIVLPGMVIRCALLWAAAVLGGELGGMSLFLPLTLYTLCTAVFSAAVMHLPGVYGKTSFAGMLCLLSLAVCPVFIDLSLIFPGIVWFRYLLPPAWLWLFAP